MKKKNFLALGLALTLGAGLVLTGCGDKKATGDANTDKGGRSVTVLSFDSKDPYTSAVLQKVKEYAQAKNIKVDVQDAQNDLGKQNDQVDVALKKADALVIQPVQNDATESLAKKITDGKKRAVFFNREHSSKEKEKAAMAGVKGVFIGTEIEKAGVMQGEIAAKVFKEHPELDKDGNGVIDYVMLKGEPSNPEAIARTKYSVEEFAKSSGLKVNRIGDDIVADWDTGKAKNALDAVLAKEKVELVFANNDGMALGAITALQEKGFNKEVPAGGKKDYSKIIPVFGVDAIVPAVEQIKKGTLEATVKQDAENMAKAIITAVDNILAGKDAKDLGGSDYKLAADGYSIRIPYLPFSIEDANK